MIVFPTTLEGASGQTGEIRAGGTDVHERRRLRISTGDVIDLREVQGLDVLRWDRGGGLRIGAKVTMAQLATDAKVAAAYPGLAQAAGALATPQIRAVGTIGGNLLQRTRCWYFRNPQTRCLKKGGDRCLARGGDHLYHSCFDTGPCVSVHPSTLGMTLLAYAASVEVHGKGARSIEALYGDGSDAGRDHALEDGALLTEIVLPPPALGERAAYFRTISRALSEWPLVEVLVRLVVERGAIRQAGIALGGVSPRPLRLPKVERALEGNPPSDTTFGRAAKLAREGANPLPMTGYKVDLVEATVLETLERAAKASPVDIAPAPAAKPERAPEGKAPAAPEAKSAGKTPTEEPTK